MSILSYEETWKRITKIVESDPNDPEAEKEMLSLLPSRKRNSPGDRFSRENLAKVYKHKLAWVDRLLVCLRSNNISFESKLKLLRGEEYSLKKTYGALRPTTEEGLANRARRKYDEAIDELVYWHGEEQVLALLGVTSKKLSDRIEEQKKKGS